MEKYKLQNFQTQFLQEEVSVGLDIQKSILECARMLNASGILSSGAGNISAEVCEGVYMKASGTSLSKMTLSDLVLVVDYIKEKEKVLVKGRKEPAPDLGLHWHIYKWFPRASAVVHVRDDLVLDNLDLAKKLKLKVVLEEDSEKDYEQLIGQSLVYDDYVIIKGHGIIAIGNDVQKARDLVLNVHTEIKELMKEE